MREQLKTLQARDAERDWSSFLVANKDSTALTPDKQADLKNLYLNGHAEFVRRHVASAPRVTTLAHGGAEPSIVVLGKDHGGAEWRACAEAAWKRLPELRNEFAGDEKAYLAFAEAKSKNRLTLSSPAFEMGDPYAPIRLIAHSYAPQYAQLSSRAVIGIFYDEFQSAFAQSWASEIGMEAGSDQASEFYPWLSAVPKFREWIGGRNVRELSQFGITLYNKPWELTEGFRVVDLRRDKTGQLRKRIGEIAEAAAEHWQEMLSTLIANGEGATNGLAYDGQYFFDTDHAEDNSGTQKNLLVAGDIPALNVATPTAPTELEMAQALLAVIAYMQELLDGVARPMNAQAKSFLVMCRGPIYAAALAASTSARVLSASGVEVDNPLRSQPLTIRPVTNPYLSAWTASFAVFRTDARMKPFILQEEQGVQMRALAEGSEYETLNNKHLYGCDASRVAGYGRWQYAAKATLS